MVMRRTWRRLLGLWLHLLPRRFLPQPSGLSRMTGLPPRLLHSNHEGRLRPRLGHVPLVNGRVWWFVGRIVRKDRSVYVQEQDRARWGWFVSILWVGHRVCPLGLLKQDASHSLFSLFFFQLTKLFSVEPSAMSSKLASSLMYQRPTIPSWQQKETNAPLCQAPFSLYTPFRSLSTLHVPRNTPERKRGTLDHVLPALRQWRSVSRS